MICYSGKLVEFDCSPFQILSSATSLKNHTTHKSVSFIAHTDIKYPLLRYAVCKYAVLLIIYIQNRSVPFKTLSVNSVIEIKNEKFIRVNNLTIYKKSSF